MTFSLKTTFFSVLPRKVLIKIKAIEKSLQSLYREKGTPPTPPLKSSAQLCHRRAKGRPLSFYSPFFLGKGIRRTSLGTGTMVFMLYSPRD